MDAPLRKETLGYAETEHKIHRYWLAVYSEDDRFRQRPRHRLFKDPGSVTKSDVLKDKGCQMTATAHRGLLQETPNEDLSSWTWPLLLLWPLVTDHASQKLWLSINGALHTNDHLPACFWSPGWITRCLLDVVKAGP